MPTSRTIWPPRAARPGTSAQATGGRRLAGGQWCTVTSTAHTLQLGRPRLIGEAVDRREKALEDVDLHRRGGCTRSAVVCGWKQAVAARPPPQPGTLSVRASRALDGMRARLVPVLERAQVHAAKDAEDEVALPVDL
eukprot:2833308-Prymnesium_polylepis.2